MHWFDKSQTYPNGGVADLYRTRYFLSWRHPFPYRLEDTSLNEHDRPLACRIVQVGLCAEKVIESKSRVKLLAEGDLGVYPALVPKGVELTIGVTGLVFDGVIEDSGSVIHRIVKFACGPFVTLALSHN